ncbi:MAG: hypothetical protein CFE38_09715 [Comamonadaceae bacterium PBBC1]|nr:MAG: hypothetical protein CFE38_09715 [Comamonadaceae bacterium PBBC1]
MAPLLEFNTDGIDSVQSMLRQGITGYAIDSLVPRGMSTIWLFLGDNTILKIYTTMTDTVGWFEVGTLVFRAVAKGDDVPEMRPLPQAWRNVTAIEKLLVVEDDFSAESGLQIGNDLGEIFTIVCSENVYRIEIEAPFIHGEFLPEYELTHYKHVPI